jgi:site-specific DNA-methyltransferase (adenine-specific)/modification methylase
MNKIYLENCFDRFAKLGNNSVDHVFTSPPYNRKRNDKYDHYNDNIDDYFKFITDVIDESIRISKGLVFFNIQKNYYNKAEVFKLFGKYSDILLEVFIWEKSNPLPAGANQVTNAYEYILIFGEKLKSNHTHTKNIIKTSVSRPLSGHHAVMHEDIPRFFFDAFTQENDLIYDPFMGVGTTALVAKKMRRQFLGSEITKEYYEASLKRINQVQIDLFL